MDQHGKKRSTIVVLLILAITVSMVAAMPLASATDDSDGENEPIVENETYEVLENESYQVPGTDKVNVWKRAIGTLRANTTDAAYTIDNADWEIKNTAGAPLQSVRDPIPVYQEDKVIRVDYGVTRVIDSEDPEEFPDGDSAQNVAVHVKDTEGQSVPQGVDEALNLLNEDNANDNVDIEIASEIDASGNDDSQSSFSHRPNSGHTFYFKVLRESGTSGIEVESGNITDINGEITVIGVEHVLTRKSEGSVTVPDKIEQGEPAEFDVNATNVTGDNVTQAVILYDEEKYVNQRFELQLEEEVSKDFNHSNATFYSDIDSVNGVTKLDGPTTTFGIEIGDGNVTSSPGLLSLVDFIGEEASTDMQDVEDYAESDNVELDASSTIISRPGTDQNITVETLDDWNSSEYRWVYMAVGQNSQEMVSDQGTLQVKEATDNKDDEKDGDDDKDGNDDKDGDDNDNDGDDGGDGNVGDTVDDDNDNTDEPPVVKPKVKTVNGNQQATVETVESGSTIVLSLSLNATDEIQTSLDGLNITSAGNASNVAISVNTSATPPSSVPTFDVSNSSFGYLNVDVQNLSDAETSEGTFTFRVSQDRLDAAGVTSEDIVLYRYHDGSWNAVETTHLDDNRFRATTPGFSTFAVGTRQASISITDAGLGQTEITPGSTVDVTTTVENTGSKEGMRTLRIRADGEVVSTQDVTVAAGESTTVNTAVTFDEAGSYEITVGDMSAGTLTVTEDSSAGTPTDGPSETGPSPDDDGGLPLVTIGVVAILAAIAGGAYYFRDTILDV